MALKKALAGSLLAATLLIAAVSLSGQADPLPLKSVQPCQRLGAYGKSCFHNEKTAIMREFARKVGLSAEQKQRVEAIQKESEDQSMPLYQKMMTERKALSDYLASPQATEQEALTRQSAMNDLCQQISQLRLAAMFRVKSILTPEQQQKAATVMKESLLAHEQNGRHCSAHHW
jgi:Spy/CpxP family protein refolding chaperone